MSSITRLALKDWSSPGSLRLITVPVRHGRLPRSRRRRVLRRGRRRVLSRRRWGVRRGRRRCVHRGRRLDLGHQRHDSRCRCGCGGGRDRRCCSPRSRCGCRSRRTGRCSDYGGRSVLLVLGIDNRAEDSEPEDASAEDPRPGLALLPVVGGITSVGSTERLSRGVGPLGPGVASPLLTVPVAIDRRIVGVWVPTSRWVHQRSVLRGTFRRTSPGPNGLLHHTKNDCRSRSSAPLRQAPIRCPGLIRSQL